MQLLAVSALHIKQSKTPPPPPTPLIPAHSLSFSLKNNKNTLISRYRDAARVGQIVNLF
jgi:hypothetical protein